ncbi:MAG: MBOAT family O-acyltransferase [Ruminococcus sp.]|nr:MBOAT family O-acyltransferase [Ruminococcus sp.]
MLFSSIPFLFYFLPCVLILYAITPKKLPCRLFAKASSNENNNSSSKQSKVATCKLKNFTLLVCSLVFYAWGEPRLVVLMLLTVFCGYLLGLLMEKYNKHKKLFLTFSVIISLGFLAYYKYIDFFIENINALSGLSIPLLKVTLPIGISFYTFQLLSYNIDVYRGNVPAQKSFINLAAYISLFPQLIAGPIVRYTDVAKQLQERTHTLDKTAIGVRRFIIGLSKKILIANTLGELCEIFKSSDNKSVIYFWIYAIAFSLHIYFDFSGYSDMAIGLGKLFGFDFIENFNYPYISKSITEFWRRWHISLGSWFRDYVYIPLGGSRIGKARLLINIFVVWMLTGFWHGAEWNFILWGLYFAVLLIAEKMFLLKRLNQSKVISRIYVCLLIVISFVIFNAGSVTEAFSYIGGMFGIGNYPLISPEAIFYLKDYCVVLLLALIGSTPIPKIIAAKLKITQWVEPFVLLALLAICTAYLVDGSFNPFLYFRF